VLRFYNHVDNERSGILAVSREGDEKFYPVMSRGAFVKAKKLGSNKVEIVATPKEGVNEKPYSCENRVGIFESVARLLTEKPAVIEHPSCFHRGDRSCRYVISWQKTPATIWKRVRSYYVLIGVLACLGLCFVLPVRTWMTKKVILGTDKGTMSGNWHQDAGKESRLKF